MLDYKVMSVNKIDCISKNYRNNECDIEFNIEHRIYKGSYNKLINFKQVFKNDIIVFHKYKASAGFYKDKLWFKFLYIMMFEKAFNVS